MLGHTPNVCLLKQMCEVRTLMFYRIVSRALFSRKPLETLLSSIVQGLSRVVKGFNVLEDEVDDIYGAWRLTLLKRPNISEKI